MGLVVDNFAGGGGASLGMTMAGYPPDIAINHDIESIAMHAANHPDTLHLCEDVYKVDIRKACRGQEVDLSWFSPDCKFFSRAKGAKPLDRKVRGLIWVMAKWGDQKRPPLMFAENVMELVDWGPLGADDRPDPKQKGKYFRKFLTRLRNLGYEVEYKCLRAHDYGAPTSRKRLFLICRRDKLPIVWPEPSHGPGLRPYRTAAECIDWSIPCPSIFERKRPLKEATLRRIAAGIQRFVLNSPKPFVVSITHAGPPRIHPLENPMPTVTAAHRGELALVQPFVVRTAHGERCKKGRKRGKGQHPIDEPLPTVLASNDYALVAPTLIQMGYGERKDQAPRVLDLHKPLGTVVAGGQKHAIVAPVIVKQNFGTKPCHGVDEPLHTVTTKGNKHSLVTAFIARHFGGMTAKDIREPLPTTTTKGCQNQLAVAHISKFYGTNVGSDPREPMPTVTATGTHLAEVLAFLVKYNGTATAADLKAPAPTITTKDRLGLVTIHGEDYQIVDIGMRMLTPRELARAQGFPDTYKLTGTKTSQVARIGNSVPPPLVEAIVRANMAVAAQEAA